MGSECISILGIWHTISNKDDLKQTFELSGDVASVDIINDRYPCASNGFDFKKSAQFIWWFYKFPDIPVPADYSIQIKNQLAPDNRNEKQVRVAVSLPLSGSGWCNAGWLEKMRGKIKCLVILSPFDNRLRIGQQDLIKCHLCSQSDSGFLSAHWIYTDCTLNQQDGAHRSLSCIHNGPRPCWLSPF